MPDLKVGVGMSRNWDAKAAGKQVATSTLEKLGKKPDIFLLFATIHYEKYGGFEKLLEGVWEHLPEGTPLVGGTVGGFINGSGCYARGATAMAISYENMDVVTAIGLNTKRNPRGAVKSCVKQIRSAFSKTKYDNKILINFLSGPVFPTVPGLKRFRPIRSKFFSVLFTYLTWLSTILLQKGPAREVEILEHLSDSLPDYNIISGSLMDNCNYISNYQFFGKRIYTNSLACVGLACDLNPKICTSHGFSVTDKKFIITKDRLWRHVLCSLDDKPAAEQYLKAVGWSKSVVDERVHTRTIFYPLGSVRGGVIMPDVIAVFLGDHLLLSHGVPTDEVYLLSTSGKKLADAIDLAISKTDSDFGLCIACELVQEMLGRSINVVQRKLKARFSDNFLVVYTAGEGVYVPQTNLPNFFQASFNITTLEH